MTRPAPGFIEQAPSPLRVFALVLLLVFSVEGLIMLLLPRLPSGWQTPARQSLVDAGLLTAIVAPALWILVGRPMQRAIEERSRLLRRLAASQEAERARIARELHDSLGQQLTAIAVALRNAADEGRTVADGQRARVLREMVAEAHREVRRLARGLRPALVEELGLAAALGQLCDDLRSTHGLEIRFEPPEKAPPRGDSIAENALFRIAQEALTNVLRHAGARSARVRLEAERGWLTLVVEDDGRGFDPARIRSGPHGSTGLGLEGIRDRAFVLGGRFRLRSTPGSGTQLLVRVPARA